jgi:2-polyprenyl-6-methoxyphenol hydroxylase-like FAD-dependent oxidoreductase
VVSPHVGQSAAFALEDAFVLAKCLRDETSRSSALATFETARRRRVEPALRVVRRIGEPRLPRNPLARRLRGLLLPVRLRKEAESLQRLYGYRADWDERVLRAG